MSEFHLLIFLFPFRLLLLLPPLPFFEAWVRIPLIFICYIVPLCLYPVLGHLLLELLLLAHVHAAISERESAPHRGIQEALQHPVSHLLVLNNVYQKVDKRVLSPLILQRIHCSSDEHLRQIVEHILAQEHGLHVGCHYILSLFLLRDVLKNFDSLILHTFVLQSPDDELLELLLRRILHDDPRDQIRAENSRLINEPRILQYVDQEELACLVRLRMPEHAIKEVEPMSVDPFVSQHLTDDASHVFLHSLYHRLLWRLEPLPEDVVLAVSWVEVGTARAATWVLTPVILVAPHAEVRRRADHQELESSRSWYQPHLSLHPLDPRLCNLLDCPKGKRLLGTHAHLQFFPPLVSLVQQKILQAVQGWVGLHSAALDGTCLHVVAEELLLEVGVGLLRQWSSAMLSGGPCSGFCLRTLLLASVLQISYFLHLPPHTFFLVHGLI